MCSIAAIAGSGVEASRLYLYTEFMSLYDSTHNSSRQTKERRKKNRPDSTRVNEHKMLLWLWLCGPA